jgi:glycosyltransferase involved in cell wall biosynthesis
VIKNGVKQGYPFWESLLSCLPIADEIVISEGGSEDGTAAYISKFAMKYGSDKLPVRIFRDDWNSKSSQHGEVISWVSEKNMRRCTREWVYYLQADEIIHEGNADFIKSVASGAAGRFNAVEFYFWHFINSWDPVKSGAAYHKAIRMVKNRPDIKLMGDAWTFHGAVQPVCKYAAVPHPLFHLGWVFPENCDVKNVEHGKIYQGMNNYQRAASASKERLANGGYEKGYSLPSDTASFPKLIARLYGKVRYELPDEALS